MKHHPYQDHYFHRAKREGYASRAVYKLMEIQERYRLLRRGMVVLDLGAAPGSWAQYAAGIVGPQGCVVGIDLKPITLSFPPQVVVLQGDIRDHRWEETLTAQYGLFDVVLSDVAPDTTGAKHADAARSAALVETALSLTRRVLKEGGYFLAKMFQGEDTPRVIQEVRRDFVSVRVVKPLASKKESREVYLLAMQRKGST